VDTFVFEIAREEKDREKCDKLTALQLTEAEWDQIDLFRNVLRVLVLPLHPSSSWNDFQSAQDAQHTFSADLRSTLHLTIPALEKLHAEWTVKSTKPKYYIFHDAIDEALQKVDKYY
jgi:hypothetical protein